MKYINSMLSFLFLLLDQNQLAVFGSSMPDSSPVLVHMEL
jgi:hypothetical protein